MSERSHSPYERSQQSSETFLKKLSLTAQFGLAAFLITSIGMSLLGHWISWHSGQSIIKTHAVSSATHFEDLIEPHLRAVGRDQPLSPKSQTTIDGIVSDGKRTVSLLALNIWSPNGTLLYSPDKSIIGQSYPLSDNIKGAFSGRLQYHFHDMDTPDDEIIAVPTESGGLFEIYTPIHDTQSQAIIGVAEIYFSPNTLLNELTNEHWTTALVFAVFALTMLGALSIIVHRGSLTITRQRLELEGRINELSRLLAENETLKLRISEASRRVSDTNDAVLKRLRADLHDGPTQLISYALLQFDEIAAKSQSRHTVNDARKVLDDALVELRQICAGIALPELDKLSLAETIALAVRNHEKRSNTNVDSAISAALPPDAAFTVKSCIFRTIQEGLNNAFHHANGEEQHVRVDHNHDGIFLQISDGGPGIESWICQNGTHRLGLIGLKNRVEALGGKFDVGRKPAGQGTVLSARIPLAAE